MKTLDEVITVMDHVEFCCTNCKLQFDCDETECFLEDALYYLKEYREKDYQLSAVFDEYQAKLADEPNEPLTWDELQKMVGKPVWVEADEKERWRIIKEVSNEHLILESGLPLHRSWMNHPDGWKAYRKDRE